MTKKQFELAKEMWRDGVSPSAIARHIGLHPNALHSFIKARPEHFP